MTDHWATLADTPLAVDSVAYAAIDPGPEFGDAHATRGVELHGRGVVGRGEDITRFLGGSGPALELAGAWTLGTFCDHLDSCDQWPDGAPDADVDELARNWRTWAYHSAALDLALAQAGTNLEAVTGRAPRPLRFVNSFGMHDEDIAGNAERRLALYPDLRLKLDAGPTWSDEVVERLAATRAVDIVDFKGRYGFDVEDEDALLDLYERVLVAFPDALVEDPHDIPAVTSLLEPHAARVAYDAPIRTVADLDAQPIAATTFNIKPSRIGRLRDLFALYDACERRGSTIYGGGMGELGVARGQIQLLAATYSPDGPNDVAPSGFNALVPAPDLPTSPLDPSAARVGFARAA